MQHSLFLRCYSNQWSSILTASMLLAPQISFFDCYRHWSWRLLRGYEVWLRGLLWNGLHSRQRRPCRVVDPDLTAMKSALGSCKLPKHKELQTKDCLRIDQFARLSSLQEEQQCDARSPQASQGKTPLAPVFIKPDLRKHQSYALLLGSVTFSIEIHMSQSSLACTREYVGPFTFFTNFKSTGWFSRCANSKVREIILQSLWLFMMNECLSEVNLCYSPCMLRSAKHVKLSLSTS